jgi:hypothetical protein
MQKFCLLSLSQTEQAAAGQTMPSKHTGTAGRSTASAVRQQHTQRTHSTASCCQCPVLGVQGTSSCCSGSPNSSSLPAAQHICMHSMHALLKASILQHVQQLWLRCTMMHCAAPWELSCRPPPALDTFCANLSPQQNGALDAYITYTAKSRLVQ